METAGLSLIFFLVKMLIVVLVILAILIGFFALMGKSRLKTKQRVEVKSLNKHYDELAEVLQQAIYDKKTLKKLQKNNKKKQAKQKAKRIFVLRFKGDTRASAVEQLREEISMLLTTVTPQDEVVVEIESPGGRVSEYGLAASQLQRLRDQNIPLTAIVDKVAASGGYMMACVAKQILAAPFAVVGSIGVAGFVPNFHRWLKKHNIDTEHFQAGKYKRTVTLTGENTKEGRQKTQEIIEDVHHLFIDFVKEHRPQVNTALISTGEFWFGERAIKLNLVDSLITSDDYLMKQRESADIYFVKTTIAKTMVDKLFGQTKAEIKNLTAVL